MAALTWDNVGTRFYELGVDRGVFYPKFGPGVAWSGLISVNEEASGGEPQPVYLDGVKVANVATLEEYSATIEAYSTPQEFLSCDGLKQVQSGLYVTGQPRKTFGMSYRTLVGNDVLGNSAGYKLHLVYGCTANPASRKYTTTGSSIEPNTTSWTVTTVPPSADTYRPTAHLIVDSRYADPVKLALLEGALYGTELDPPELPTQSSVMAMLA